MLHGARIGWLILVLAAYLTAHPPDVRGLAGGLAAACLDLSAGLLPATGTAGVTLLWLGVVNLACTGAGGRVLRFLGLPAAGWRAIALGLGAVMPVWLALGLAGLWLPGIAVATLVAGVVVAGRIPGGWRDHASRLNHPSALLLLPALVALGAALVVPETGYDPVLYHLGLGRRYAVVHKIVRLEQLHLAGFPQNASMLFGWLAAFGGDALAKAVNLELIVLTACAMAGIAGASTRTALLLLLASPLVWLYASSAYAEAALACFVTAALGCVARRGAREAVLAGVFAGLAAGTKYQAVQSLLPLLAVAWWRRDRLALRRPAAVFAVAACAIIGWLPWGAKNWLLTGNPVHPLLERAFPSIEGAWTVPEQRPWLNPPADGWVRGFLAGPWRFVMQDRPENGDARGPLLLAVLPWIAAGPAALFAAGFWAVWWCLTRDVGRYVLPLLPALLAAAWTGWRARAAFTPPRARRAQAVLFAATIAVGHLGGLELVVRNLDPFAAVAGCTTADVLLRARFGAVRYAVHARFDRERAPARRALACGDPLPLFHTGPWLMDTESRTPWLERRARESRDAAGLAKAIRQRNVDRILYWMNGGIQLGEGAQGASWTPRTLTILQEYLAAYGRLAVLHETPTGADSWYAWRLSRAPAARRPAESGLVGMHLPTAEFLLLPGDRAHAAGDRVRARRLYAGVIARFPGYVQAHRRLRMAGGR